MHRICNPKGKAEKATTLISHQDGREGGGEGEGVEKSVYCDPIGVNLAEDLISQKIGIAKLSGSKNCKPKGLFSYYVGQQSSAFVNPPSPLFA